MPKALVGIILMLMVATGSGSTPVPRNAIALAPYASNRQITTGVTRLRVTVATDAAQGERAVRVGDILICKATECFWARTAGYVDVENTSTGAASVLADVLFPMNTITDVYFTAMTGRAVIEGHLQLAEPVVIEEDFPGIELFIGVRKQHAARQTVYLPSQSGNMYFRSESELIHYLPAMQTVAPMSLGTVLTIPAGALDKAQVFNVAAYDVGDMYPRIDIYPYLKLNKPATLEAAALRDERSNRAMIVAVDAGEERARRMAQAGPVSTRNARLTLDRTRAVDAATLEDSVFPSTPSDLSCDPLRIP